MGLNLFERRALEHLRTIKGINGERLICFPGVVHPKQKPFEISLEKKPDWAITSKAAAELLGMHPASARNILHRHGVRYCKVSNHDRVHMTCWAKEEVEDLAKNLPPLIDAIPPELMSTRQVCEVTGYSVTAIMRWVKKGMLTRLNVRVRSSKYAGPQFLYLREEIEEMKKFLSWIGRNHG